MRAQEKPTAARSIEMWQAPPRAGGPRSSATGAAAADLYTGSAARAAGSRPADPLRAGGVEQDGPEPAEHTGRRGSLAARPDGTPLSLDADASAALGGRTQRRAGPRPGGRCEGAPRWPTCGCVTPPGRRASAGRRRSWEQGRRGAAMGCRPLPALARGRPAGCLVGHSARGSRRRHACIKGGDGSPARRLVHRFRHAQQLELDSNSPSESPARNVAHASRCSFSTSPPFSSPPAVLPLSSGAMCTGRLPATLCYVKSG